MDRFVMKSSKSRSESVHTPLHAEKTQSKRKPKFDKKQYKAKKRRRAFQPSWLKEFSWLARDVDRDVMKC